MGWLLLDSTDCVLSIGYGTGPSDVPAGHRVQSVESPRLEQVMDGKVPLAMALLSDEQLLRMATVPVVQSRAMRTQVITYEHCTYMGDNFNEHIWNVILSRVDLALLAGWHLVIWDWRYNNHQPIHATFNWAEWEKITQLQDVSRIIFIIDSHWEAPNPVVHFSPLCQRLIQQGLDKSRIINWTNIPAVFDEGTTIDMRYVLSAGSGHPIIVDAAVDATHHFVFLARQPRPLRVMAAAQILTRGLDTFGSISCGVNNEQDISWIEQWVPDQLQHRFPLLLDGMIAQSDAMQYDVRDPRIYHAAINVVCETSQDVHLTLPRHDWFDPFVTEKTTKAFRLCQLPIWIGVKGMVNAVRELGLDVYDDVIDHSYDTVDDPVTRVTMAVDQLEKLCKLNLDQLNELRQVLWPRMLANKHSIESRIAKVYPSISNLLSQHLASIR
jgi:hypothetical protein